MYVVSLNDELSSFDTRSEAELFIERTKAAIEARGNQVMDVRIGLINPNLKVVSAYPELALKTKAASPVHLSPLGRNVRGGVPWYGDFGYDRAAQYFKEKHDLKVCAVSIRNWFKKGRHGIKLKALTPAAIDEFISKFPRWDGMPWFIPEAS